MAILYRQQFDLVSPRVRRCLGAPVLVLVFLFVQAGLFAPSATGQQVDSIDLNTAITRTLINNPSLKAEGFQTNIQEARVLQAGIKPRPQLDVQLEDFVGTDRYDLFGSSQATVSITWVLNHGLTSRQVDAARSRLSVIESERLVQRLDAAAETARRFMLCLALQAQLDNAAQGVALGEAAVAAIEQRVAAATTTQAELLRARADLRQLELTYEDFEHEVLGAYYRLSAQWGETEPDFSTVDGELLAVPELESFSDLQSRLQENPDLTKFFSEQRMNEAQLTLERARNRASWNVSAGVRRLQASQDLAFVAGISIPLGNPDINRGRVEEVRARIAQTESELAAEQVRLQTELFVLYQELVHFVELTQAISNDIVPLYQQALEETQRAYETGLLGYLELNAAQRSVMSSRYDLIEAALGVYQNLIEIERLTGVAIDVPETLQ